MRGAAPTSCAAARAAAPQRPAPARAAAAWRSGDGAPRAAAAPGAAPGAAAARQQLAAAAAAALLLAGAGPAGAEDGAGPFAGMTGGWVDLSGAAACAARGALCLRGTPPPTGRAAAVKRGHVRLRARRGPARPAPRRPACATLRRRAAQQAGAGGAGVPAVRREGGGEVGRCVMHGCFQPACVRANEAGRRHEAGGRRSPAPRQPPPHLAGSPTPRRCAC
jgi:hypothetical protein